MGINVKIGNAIPARVQSSATFFGATDQIALINSIGVTANNAAAEANTAIALSYGALQTTGGEITGILIVDQGIYGNVSVVDAGTF